MAALTTDYHITTTFQGPMSTMYGDILSVCSLLTLLSQLTPSSHYFDCNTTPIEVGQQN